jgi:hypothetical protein
MSQKFTLFVTKYSLQYYTFLHIVFSIMSFLYVIAYKKPPPIGEGLT